MITVPTHIPTYSTPPALALPRWRAVARSAADALHAPADRRAWGDGLTVARVGLTGREYRSPLFDQGARREG